MAEIEVVSRPQSFSVASIPPQLVEYFAARGKKLTFQSATLENATKCQGQGMIPVLIDEVPEHLHPVVRASFLPWKRFDGELHRSDCVLCAQPLEERNAWEVEYQRRKMVMENAAEASASSMQDMVKNVPNSWVKVNPENVQPIAAHISGGPEFARAIQNELAGVTAQSGKKERS